MRKAIRFLGTAAFVAVATWACSDVREPSTIFEVEPLQAVTGPCDLSALKTNAGNYLPSGNPNYRKQATDRITLIEANGCGSAGDEQLAWEVLNIVEHVAELGVGDSEAAGAALVNGLQTYSLAVPAQNVVAAVLDQGGLFGIRGTPGPLPYAVAGTLDTLPVLSRQPVPMWFRANGADPVVRQAIIALRPRAGSWATVAKDGANVLGLTGYPVDFNGGAYDAYELDEIPDLGFSAQIDVIACFTDNATALPDPHPEGQEGFAPRVLRSGLSGGILLQEVSDAAVASFCASVPGTQIASRQPSALATLARFAGNLFLPQPLSAFAVAFSDRTSGGMGGGATFFSKFKLNNSDPDGVLAFVGPVPTGSIKKNATFDIKVSAKDGDGKPIELTTLLTLMNNNGVPGFLQGTFTNCEGIETSTPPATPAVGCTKETAVPEDGGIAEYDDISISKTGAYILCVEAFSPGFNFPKVCTLKFNVK
jgi:hypothetical protein